MKGGPPTLIACAALLLAAGCGSSSRPSKSPARGSSAPAPSASTGKFKASTTPKFATPPATAPVQSGTVKIAYRNITIAPDTVKVKVGSTIVWTNYDPVEHNVTSRSGPASLASKNFGEGKSFSVTLTRPGVIHYLCTIHPTTMNGTIAVIS
jgi:plastocyanin